MKANLVDAERMFEAMGYNLLPNHSLVLDGPICPDQVTNVSRDAMTAYVECQVIVTELLPINTLQKLLDQIIIRTNQFTDYEANISRFSCNAVANNLARDL